ncbi:uncharacterized protein [Euwallacea fornicatus]|uniref:uncharacterized protein n=1 Tax=Euwallacea fornicatus TaxID=995702 RepID=UPI00338E2FEC
MGNKLCKKKGDADAVDSCSGAPRSSLDRIFNRFHLKATTPWRSESHLHKKDPNRAESCQDGNKNGTSILYTSPPLSKSADWTEVDLEVPSLEDEVHVHLPNPKLNLIFDNEKGIPTPPPRHKQQQQKKNKLRERVEKMATKGLQALQGNDKAKPDSKPVPVEEPLMIKKTIKYVCPICESDERSHNRDHHHPPLSNTNKRQKNLSVVSLPNYTDLKLSVAQPQSLTDHKSHIPAEINSSRLSLQSPKKPQHNQTTGRLMDSYITRCRSLGSILPQQLKKLKASKLKPDKPVTSDDSFGPLEDWDADLIEHYNPKDASLPRPRKMVSDQEVLQGIEGLVVKPEDVAPHPQRPLRKSDSLIRKETSDASMAPKTGTKLLDDICLTPPPSPVHEIIGIGRGKKIAALSRNFEHPNSHVPIDDKQNKTQESAHEDDKESVGEHSSLMRILQEFSVKDTQNKATAASVQHESKKVPSTPASQGLEECVRGSEIEDFIKAEKKHSDEVVCS